jgi:3-hydroxyacyl-CoA dehydrogenase/3a,7a,12a-trihydroxy-5b-cholest-24-enoyl-CoA hydratase
MFTVKLNKTFIAEMNPELAKKHQPPPETFSYTIRDAILYALGIGAKATNLQWAYESDEEFHVFPTFVIAPALLSNSLGDWPGVKFDLTRILHGEQYIEVFEPLPLDGEVVSTVRIADIIDKGSGALILTDINISDKRSGKKLAYLQMATFQVGGGNFGGAKNSSAAINGVPPPQRSPDKTVEEKISKDQAALYRLGSRDMNPLHIDPMFAQMGGFKEPILHGMCSLGFSTRHVIEAFAEGDARKLKAVKARFTSPVSLGSTLVTEMWKENSRIHFQTKVKETGKTVINNAYVDLHGKNSKL